MELLKTHLHPLHIHHKAQMAPFAGHEMPIQYSSIKQEVNSVRSAVGIFDVGHMGEFFIEGPETLDFINYIITNDIKGVPVNKAVYSPICRENGTVIDDLIVYKLSNQKCLICVNAANIDKDWEHFQTNKPLFNCHLSNRSNNFSLLAVQGPQSENILRKIEIIPKDEHLDYYEAKEFQNSGHDIIVARTGYTGEDGFEIFCPHAFVINLWKALIDNGATPCGLAARDILRLEVCYPLYGHELHDDVTPLDSNLKWTVKFEKEKFIGKESLENYERKFKLVKLILDKGIPRAGHKVEDSAGNEIGTITSGTHSPTLGKGIALAHISVNQFPNDEKFIINIRNKKYEAQLNKRPFVTGGHK